MQIVRLTAENVKRLKAVEITPAGQIVEITGKNAQGKTSVLDSIMYAMGGTSRLPDMPVRAGEKAAKIVVELGDLTVTRTITVDGGGSLNVSSKDGAKYPSPQKMLDKLTGKLCFDPLSFTRQEPKEQAAILQKLTGLDFKKQEAERKAAFDERTVANRDCKALQAQVDTAPGYPDAPKEEVNVGDVLAKLKQARSVNAAKARLVERVSAFVSVEHALEKEVEEAQAKVAEAQLALLDAKREADDVKEALEIAGRETGDARTTADSAPVADESVFEQQVSDSQGVNAKVRANAARVALEAHLEKRKAEAVSLSKQIDDIDAAKAKALSEAKFPVPGLTFDENGVYFNGVPFNQSSSREQVVVSAAIGISMNPKLRVLLIRDGSLLDEDAMADLGNWADENKAQIWIERVAGDKEVGIVIEDGAVKPAETSSGVTMR